MMAVVELLWFLARSLLLTIAFELPLGLLFVRERTWREVLVIALAQVVTNPSVQLACIWLGWSIALPLTSLPWVVLIFAEVGAVVVEALLYREADVTEHPWAMSAVLNVASFGIGLVLGSAGLL